MPVATIPFRSPPPFELPPHVLDEVRQNPPGEAAQRVVSLLDQLDAGDMQIVVFRGSSGQLVPGALVANDAAVTDALKAAVSELGQAEGTVDFARQAIAQGVPLLMMGELEAGDHSLFPKALATVLLGGMAKAPIGFFYVFPLVDTTGQARGALALHRSLAAGPLNHDQPAIAQALVTELAARLAAHSSAL